jgi:type I restriction enzyme M protein
LKNIFEEGELAQEAVVKNFFTTAADGKKCVVECEPDSGLRDTEQIPLFEEGGIEAFIRREALPHASDAWYDPASIRTGYGISFNRYFYKPQPLRSLEEIRADILELEKETEGLPGEIIGLEERSSV